VPIVGYCHECAEWVWVATDRSCPKGHPASRVNGWYDSETGQPVETAAAEPPAAAPAAAPVAPVSGTRVGFLTDLMAAFAQSPSYSAAWGTDTDMTISSNPLDGMWGAGKKRAEYSAALKVSEADRTVCFWELLKERSSGISFGTFESETYTTVGAKRSGTKRETVVGPGPASWEWGYGTTRKVVEEVAARHGFSVRVVLTRGAAAW
jgi:hypothetical protein